MKEIEREITTKRKVYIANDGREFPTEYECRSYEEEATKAELLVKRKKIFGEPLTDEATQWMGNLTEWYTVKIANENDLLDFLAVVQKDGHFYDDCGRFGEKFVEEVLATIKNKKIFEMLLSVAEDGYTARYGRNYTSSNPNHKTWYENAMRDISNMSKLAKEMKKYVSFTEVEAE